MPKPPINFTVCLIHKKEFLEGTGRREDVLLHEFPLTCLVWSGRGLHSPESM